MKSTTRVLNMLTLCLGLLVSSFSSATPSVTYSGGLAVGVQDLVVNSVNYDVSFISGSYNTVFASNLPTFLGNSSGANAAANALLNVMNGESAALLGSGGSCCGVLWIPYLDHFQNGLGDTTPPSGASSDWYKGTQTGYEDGTGETWRRYGDFTDLKAADRSNVGNDWMFAVFTADPQNTVPEPSSVFLVGAALAGLALRRRRQIH